MLNNESIIVTIIIIITIHSFILGYFFGHYLNKNGVNNNTSFFTKQKEIEQQKTSISIDDKKFVTEIKTDNLEKKYSSLGEIKSTSENISGSVNKLKNLKG
jgi:hypothetical protein